MLLQQVTSPSGVDIGQAPGHLYYGVQRQVTLRSPSLLLGGLTTRWQASSTQRPWLEHLPGSGHWGWKLPSQLCCLDPLGRRVQLQVQG